MPTTTALMIRSSELYLECGGFFISNERDSIYDSQYFTNINDEHDTTNDIYPPRVCYRIVSGRL